MFTSAAVTMTLALVPCKHPASTGAVARSRSPRNDADRCYYGSVDAEGNVVEVETAKRMQSPIQTPHPSLTALNVVDVQFECFSRGRFSDIEAAFAFVSPQIIQQYSLDFARFRQILEKPGFEGIIGCTSWSVMGTSSPSDDVVFVKLKLLPKPIPGCVRISGISDQGGISWPAFYTWQLVRQKTEPFVDCWMLEQMSPEPPPIDVDVRDDTPLVAPAEK